MAITIPAGLELRKVIDGLTQRRYTTGFQAFQDRRKDFNILKGFYASNQIFDPEIVRMQRDARNTYLQEVAIRYRDPILPGTGTVRKISGTGGITENEIVFPLQSAIVEEFDLGANNLSRVQRNMGVSDSDVREWALAELMREKYLNMMTRANAQALAYLDSIIWQLNTVADEGTRYTTYLANIKQVPAADLTDGTFLNKTWTEAQENSFTSYGNPFLFGSSTLREQLTRYKQFGANNSQNLSNIMTWYDDTFIDNNVVNGAGAELTYYLVAPGGIGAANWTKDHTEAAENSGHIQADGSLVAGSDIWLPPMEAPMLIEDQPDFKVEIKKRIEAADTSGTEGAGAEAGFTESYVMTTTFVFMVAPNPTTGIFPVIKYEVK